MGSYGSCGLDLDYDRKGKAFEGQHPVTVWQTVRERIEAAGLPLPSFVLASGRGLHLVWTFENEKGNLGKKWRAVMRYLTGRRLKDLPDADEALDKSLMAERGKVWRGLNLDLAATDPSRVLRLCGSWNKKAGRQVQMVYPESFEDAHRYRFSDLADRILPFTGEQIATMRAERAIEKAVKASAKAQAPAALPVPAVASVKARGPAKGPLLGSRSLWRTYASDIEKLVAGRWGGRVPGGARDLILFLRSLAEAWTEDSCDRQDWFAQFGGMLDLCRKFTARDGVSYLSTLAKRAQEAMAGGKRSWDGCEFDPRYGFRADTICRWLGATADDARRFDMRAVIPADAEGDVLRAERAAQRVKAWRVRNGGRTHEVRACARLATGVEALALREKGETVKALMARFGRSRDYLYQAMAEAKAAPAKVEVAANDNPIQAVSAIRNGVYGGAMGEALKALSAPLRPARPASFPSATLPRPAGKPTGGLKRHARSSAHAGKQPRSLPSPGRPVPQDVVKGIMDLIASGDW